jgi:hypothetical protein
MEELIHRIDKNVSVLISKQEDIIKIIEKHENKIQSLEQTKFIVYGVCIAASGIFSIIMRIFM